MSENLVVTPVVVVTLGMDNIKEETILYTLINRIAILVISCSDCIKPKTFCPISFIVLTVFMTDFNTVAVFSGFKTRLEKSASSC